MAKTRRARSGKKGTRKLSSWNLLVMKVFKEMKAKNKNASFSDALKEASKRKALEPSRQARTGSTAQLKPHRKARQRRARQRRAG